MRIFKKILMPLAIVAVAVGVALPSPASALSLGGTKYLTPTGDWSNKYTTNMQSNGGTFQVVIPAHKAKAGGTSMTVQLWEDDGVSGDDFVREWVVKPDNTGYSLTITNASDYIDGSDGNAEFYLKYSSNYTTSSSLAAKYYD